MAYCTKQDILDLEMTQAELITLTDDKSLGAVADAMVAKAIAKADAEIDAACQGRYAVPFNPIPTIVMGWSATLAAFNLYRNRAKPSTLIDRYNKVMSWLSDVKTGTKAISGITVDTYSLPASTTDGTVPTFTRTQRDADGRVIGTPGTTDAW